MEDAIILFVDDVPINAELFIQLLRMHGYSNEVVTAEDGIEALDYLFARNTHAGRDASVKPRLIVLDLSMPRMDGLETLRQLRQDERTRLLPVVMLTATNHSADQAKAYRLGANGYVDKLSDVPFPEVVKRITDYWLGLNKPAPT